MGLGGILVRTAGLLGNRRVSIIEKTHIVRRNKWLLGMSLAITIGVLATASAVLGSTSQINSLSPEVEPQAPPPLTGYRPSSGPVLTDEQIAQIARTQAARAGEEAPTMTAVDTMLKNAVEVNPGNQVNASSLGMEVLMESEVVLVTLHGHFTLEDAPVPKGHSQPTGSVLTLTIDAHTGWVDSRELSDTPAPGIADLGVARTLQ
jgi:hypothetical protein